MNVNARRRSPHPKRLAVSWFGTVFVVAVVLNFVWEMAQAYFYQSMGTLWDATRRCLVASVADGGMVLLVLVTAHLLADRSSQAIDKREYGLTIALGVAIAAAVEWWGLATDRWAYRAQMPMVPGTHLGVVPVFQIAALAPLTLWLAGRVGLQRTKRRGRGEYPGLSNRQFRS